MAFLTVRPYRTDTQAVVPVAHRIVEATVAVGVVMNQPSRGLAANDRHSPDRDARRRREAAYAMDGQIRRGMYIDRFV